MSERERADFTLHELWCLREAVYKLCGRGSLRISALLLDDIKKARTKNLS